MWMGENECEDVPVVDFNVCPRVWYFHCQVMIVKARLIQILWTSSECKEVWIMFIESVFFVLDLWFWHALDFLWPNSGWKYVAMMLFRVHL